jgi:membrane protease YdiL (CAAX protease family)
MAGDFVLQIVFYSLGGGLFWPVLLGTIGGVFVPVYLIARNAGLPLRADFSLHWRHPVILLGAGLMAVAALAPTALLAQLSLRLHPPGPEWTAFMAESMPEGPAAIALAFLTVVVLAPLAEEIVFRGLLHRLAAQVWGRWPAVIISSLVFGVVHGEPWYLFGLIGIGMVLAVVYEATGSVLACWITHVVHNGVSLTMMIWSDQPTSEAARLSLLDWVIASGSLVLLVLLGAFLLQSYRPVRTVKNPDQS